MQQTIKIGDVLRSSHRLFAQNKTLIIPFGIVALCDYIALTCIYLAPRYPLSVVFAPPIRKLWGEQYLHYPQNFVLIPRLFNYAHLCILFTVGILMTGFFIKMCHIVYQSKRKVLKTNVFVPACMIAVKKYIPMTVYFVLFYALSMAVFSLVARLMEAVVAPVAIIQVLQVSINFVAGVLLQTAFAFVFPAIIISDFGLVRALAKNCTMVFAYFIKIGIIVLLPSLIYLLITANKYFLPALVRRYEPEIVLVSLGVEIILMVIIDILVTGYTTVFYIQSEGTTQK